MRHLPYIKEDLEGELNGKIAPEADAFQYEGGRAMPPNGAASNTWPPGAGEISDHVAMLMTEACYGSWLLLDTKEGQPTHPHNVIVFFACRNQRHHHRSHPKRASRARRTYEGRSGLLACI